ncbi:conserved hypothetical protein [delta proteobacterium NaphS2]|nr:conserved hypothetical protein [delta proteobacterium NaphS2]
MAAWELGTGTNKATIRNITTDKKQTLFFMDPLLINKKLCISVNILIWQSKSYAKSKYTALTY